MNFENYNREETYKSMDSERDEESLAEEEVDDIDWDGLNEEEREYEEAHQEDALDDLLELGIFLNEMKNNRRNKK